MSENSNVQGSFGEYSEGEKMENLIFSLNATIPIFLLMVLGVFFRRVGLIKGELIGGLNQFVFKAALPVLLFGDLAVEDFTSVWDTRFVVFCFGTTLLSITIVYLISLTLKDSSIRGEFVQGSYRSSAAILGIAFIKNIYGTSGMAPLMIVGSVPLYNVMAVVVLSFMRPGQSGMSDPTLLKKTLRGIATNPIILGIFFGALWSVLKIPMPAIMLKTVNTLGGMATPLGLMAMGAGFDWKQAKRGIPWQFYETIWTLRDLSSCGSLLRLPGGKIDCDSRHAWLKYDGQQLCHGPQYGTRRSSHLKHCRIDDLRKCVFVDVLVIFIKDIRVDLKLQPHLVPHDIAVYGHRDSLIFKSK